MTEMAVPHKLTSVTRQQRDCSEPFAGARADDRGRDPPPLVACVSGQRQSTGGRKIPGRQRRRPLGVVNPAAGALAELVLRWFHESRLGQQVEKARSDRLSAEQNAPGSIATDRPPSASCAQAGVFLIRARRSQPGRIVKRRPLGAGRAAVVSPGKLCRVTPEPDDEFDYFERRPELRLAICRQEPRPSRFRSAMLSSMPDRAGPFDQSEGMAREPIELLRIALASGVLQRIDSSAAKLLGVLWFLARIKVGHRSRSRDRRIIGNR